MKLPGCSDTSRRTSSRKSAANRGNSTISRHGSSAGQSQFKQNILSFAVSYGLCLQGLGKSEIQTNLLPERNHSFRLVRAKKPWAVAGLAALMMGMTFNYAMHVSAGRDTATDEMTRAESALKNGEDQVGRIQGNSTEIRSSYEQIKRAGQRLVSNVEGRLLWLELMKAVEAAIPRDQRPIEEREETAEDISNRKELHIESIDQQHFADLQGEWFSTVESMYLEKRGMADGAGGEESAAGGEEPSFDAAGGGDAGGGEEGGGGLSGPGWVIQLTGYHYHNKDKSNQTSRFVNNTLIKNLEEGFIELPDGPNGEMVKVSFADLGISHPWVVQDKQIEKSKSISTRQPELPQRIDEVEVATGASLAESMVDTEEAERLPPPRPKNGDEGPNNR